MVEDIKQVLHYCGQSVTDLTKEQLIEALTWLHQENQALERENRHYRRQALASYEPQMAAHCARLCEHSARRR